MGLQQSHTETVGARPLRQGGPGHVTVLDIDKISERQEDSSRKVQGLTRLLEVNKSRNGDVYQNEFDHHEDNLIILKQLFKKMEPGITQGGSCNSQGQIQLSFKHDPTKQVLMVKIISACDLNAKNLRGKSANAYVMMSMLPSSVDRASYKTKIVKNSLSPVFHELFAFQITEAELESGSVIFQVWDADRMDQDELIGELMVMLRTLHLNQCHVHTDWYHLKVQMSREMCGSVCVSMEYDDMKGTLAATVHSADRITNRYTQGAPNPFVKLQIPGLKQLYKTQIVYNTVNPEWQQTFHFPVSAQDISTRSLVLHVIDHDEADRNESLGQVVINLADVDLSHNFTQTFHLSDLKKFKDIPRALTSKQNTAIQEFREALVAHACVKRPKLLFQNQSGSKTIRIRNTKLRMETKLRIIDGVPIY